MRRVVLLVFGTGALSVLAIWRMAAADGTIAAFNRVDGRNCCRVAQEPED